MSNQNGGAGNLIIKGLNGIGLVAILAAVAIAGLEWGKVDRLKADVASHYEEQVQQVSQQQQIDNQQDRTVQMYNEALIRIEAKMEAMKEQQDEIKAILRETP